MASLFTIPWMEKWKNYKPEQFASKSRRRKKPLRSRKTNYGQKFLHQKQDWPEAASRWSDVNFQEYILG